MASAFEAGSALRKVHLLVGSQLVVRVFTFILNAWVARSVGLAAYGLFSVDLYLAESIVLLLAREGIRRSCLRFVPKTSTLRLDPTRTGASTTTQLHSFYRMLNTAWLAVPAAFAVGSLAALLFALRSDSQVFVDSSMRESYVRSLWLTALASTVAALGEPLYIIAEIHVWYHLRASVEAMAVFFRCIATYILVVHFDLGLVAFAWAQLAHGVAFTAGYVWYFWRHAAANRSLRERGLSMHEPCVTSLAQLGPHRIKDSMQLDPALTELVRSFMLQSFFKLLLTEGEKLALVTVGSSLDDQGVYGLVHNLGSLAARLIFFPLEETAKTEFSLLLGPGPAADESSGHSKKKEEEERSAGEPSGPAAAATVLEMLLRLVILIGLVFACFGPNYSFTLFHVIYGSRWSGTGAPMVLSVYCVYVLFIAVNGITEAFLVSAMSASELSRYNWVMVVFSALYVALSVAVLRLRWGPVGVILANCLNMLARIIYAWQFVRRFFSSRLDSRGASVDILARSWPRWVVFAVLAGAAFVTHLSSNLFDVEHEPSLLRFGGHAAVGFVALLVVGWSVWRFEHEWYRAIVAVFRHAKQKKIE